MEIKLIIMSKLSKTILPLEVYQPKFLLLLQVYSLLFIILCSFAQYSWFLNCTRIIAKCWRVRKMCAKVTHTHTVPPLLLFIFFADPRRPLFPPFLKTQQAHIKMFVLVMAIFCTRSFFSIFMNALKYFFTNIQGSFHTDGPFIADFALP